MPVAGWLLRWCIYFWFVFFRSPQMHLWVFWDSSLPPIHHLHNTSTLTPILTPVFDYHTILKWCEFFFSFSLFSKAGADTLAFNVMEAGALDIHLVMTMVVETMQVRFFLFSFGFSLFKGWCKYFSILLWNVEIHHTREIMGKVDQQFTLNENNMQEVLSIKTEKECLSSLPMS